MKKYLTFPFFWLVFFCTMTACSNPSKPPQNENSSEAIAESNQESNNPQEQAPKQEATTPENPQESTQDAAEPNERDERESPEANAPEERRETNTEPLQESPPEEHPEGPTNCQPLPSSNIQTTWSNMKKQKPLATGMLVYQNGKKIFEAYAPKNANPLLPSGGTPNKPYLLYSKTKSLAGLTALLLIKQGKLQLSDPVSKYIPQWRNDKDKKTITIQELLTLSSGIQTKIVSPRQMSLTIAINAPFTGKKFAYGTAPFIVFAQVVKTVANEDGETYIKRELFDKLGINIKIGRVKGGTLNFASGGQTTLPHIRRLGQELVDATRGKGLVFDANDIAKLYTTGQNPAYGLTVWLNQNGKDAQGKSTPAQWPACIQPQGMFSFFGAGGQVLTLIPAKNLVIAKSSDIGSVDSQNQRNIWSTLFQGVGCSCNNP